MRAIRNILNHDKGRWILQDHQEHKAEYALTNFKDKVFKNKIIDRTFVDEEIRWIIDYKTGQHEGGNLEKFFEDEIDRYRDQLNTYEQLISLQGESRPIKKALYYPLHQRLVEVL